MTNERVALLRDAIAMNGNLNEIKFEFSKMAFDTDFPLVLISADDILTVMNRYLNGKVDAGSIEAWAEFLESRDDVGFCPPSSDFLQRTVQELANPVLFGGLNVETAKKIVEQLVGL